MFFRDKINKQPPRIDKIKTIGIILYATRNLDKRGHDGLTHVTTHTYTSCRRAGGGVFLFFQRATRTRELTGT